MPVFLIEESQVQDGSVHIRGPLLRHLHASLRIAAGDKLVLVVPRQRRFVVRVDRVDSRALIGVILDEQPAPIPEGPRVVLAPALLKGDRMDWLIQKATELGVADILPLVTHLGVVRPRPDRVQTQRERWQRIATEAAQQSERWESPSIAVPMDVDVFFQDQRPASLRLLLSERLDGQSMSSVGLPIEGIDRMILAVGPEGGWKSEEVGDAIRCGFIAVTLGPRILRAETAGLAALTILQSRLGRLG